MFRRSTIAALAVLALALTSTSAFAQNAGSTEVFTEEIQFTFPAGTCPDFPDGLSIDFTGTLRGHFHQSTDAQGVRHFSVNTTITGSAVDSEGATYRFNYHDALHWSFAGAPFVLTITDHFNLVGNGAANQLHTFFVIKLLISAEGEEVLFLNEHGDPEHCDPL